MRTADVARVCHEANRAYCEALGDFSQPRWEMAPAWQKESAIAGVRAHSGPVKPSPAQSHQNWMDMKTAEGWTYGETKDPRNKTHPCMVPFDELPPEQQAKDHIFAGVVYALGIHNDDATGGG